MPQPVSPFDEYLCRRHSELWLERRRTLDVDGPDAPRALPGHAEAAARSDAIEDLLMDPDHPIEPRGRADYDAWYRAEHMEAQRHR